MRWKYCNYCLIDGACENQDRGHECEMPVKKLCEENDKLKKLLKECEHIIEDSWMYSGMATPVRDDIISKINEALK